MEKKEQKINEFVQHCAGIYMNNKLSFYEKIVYLAYGYFILFSLAWLAASFYFGGYFNYRASATLIIFATQAYFHKKLTNLILGILAFRLSIFWILEFISMGAKAGYDAFVDIMLSLSVISAVMAVILIFSYTKLSFKGQ